MLVWFFCTVASLPPLDGVSSEAARGRLLTAMAIAGTLVYAVSAYRYAMNRLPLLTGQTIGGSKKSRPNTIRKISFGSTRTFGRWPESDC